MMYRTKKRWRKISRYAQFVEKCNMEKERDEKRQLLKNTLEAILDQRSREYWDRTKPILEKMRDELNDLGKVPSYKDTKGVIEFCIAIFDISSRAQDALEDGKLLCAPGGEEQLKALSNFNNDLYYCGRHTSKDLRNDSICGSVPYWNTTLKGTPINADTIMFGPEIGSPRKPASYWLQISKKKKINILETTSYYKCGGNISKPISVWVTDGLVRIGILKFCRQAMENLPKELDILLA
jgi:hypothetical protein